MRIAVTGGSGRVGRAVIDLVLAQEHSVVSIDRTQPGPAADQANVPFVQVDMMDYADVERALEGCDALIHLAAIPAPGGHPDHVVHNNNVVSSYNALLAAAQLEIKHVCQASSVNATGAAYSRSPHYDYFPLDEEHPTYNEDPYSLSKWICEQQADSIARRYEDMTIASLRFHWVVPERSTAVTWGRNESGMVAKHLWGYTSLDAAARACLLSVTATYRGHEVFYIVAPDTTVDTPSLELSQRFFPGIPVRGTFAGNHSFFNSSKAERLLGWQHDTH